MGGSQSQTRTVTVENPDHNGAIIITEAVAKRLTGEKDETRAASEREAKQEEQQRRQAENDERMFELFAREMHRAKRDLDREKEVFRETVKEVEEKFMKQTMSPVCQDLQQQVFHCYQDNSKQPLHCSHQVRDFFGCVEKARHSSLASKG